VPHRNLSTKPNWLDINSGDHTYVVHYSCHEFSTASGEPPPIWSVALLHAPTNRTDLIDCGDNELEKLNEVAARFEADIKAGASYVTYNMRSEKYGFEGIAKRHQFLGGIPFIPPKDRCFDLKAGIQAVYGNDFAPHPRLPELMRLNGITTEDLFFPAGDSSAANGDNWSPLDAMQRKVYAIRQLLRLFANGELVTARGRVTDESRRGRPKADDEKAEYEKEQRESNIVDSWKKAKKAGVRMVDFATQNKMTSKEFKKMSARVRMRNLRANEPREQ
jgi:hypothetical protein